MKNKIDTRTLPIETIEEKQRTTIELRKTGMSRKEIGGIVGVHADLMSSRNSIFAKTYLLLISLIFLGVSS